MSRGTVMPYVLLSDIPRPEMVLVRSQSGVAMGAVDGSARTPVYALFFVVGDKARAGETLRILAQLAAHADNDAFLRSWNVVRDEQELKEILLADERFLSLQLAADSSTAPLIGKALRDVALPEGVLVALVRRDGRTVIPRGSTVLREQDRLTVIGDAQALRALAADYDA